MTQHELKTDPAVFQAVKRREKKFEIRKNDRSFKPGDKLLLRETKHTGADMYEHSEVFPLIYTGEELLVYVTHVLYGPIYGLQAGWCIMSIEHLCTKGDPK